MVLLFEANIATATPNIRHRNLERVNRTDPGQFRTTENPVFGHIYAYRPENGNLTDQSYRVICE